MSKMLVALFDSYSYAEKAAKQIRDEGLRTDDISLVTKENEEKVRDKDQGTHMEGRARNDNISDGVVSGGILGGVAGLLIGAGSMAIPGLGIIAAAGPITGLLSGAVTGGIVGGLIDLGIPKEKGRQYEASIKEGKVLFSMKTDEDKVDQITSILSNNGATGIDTY